MTLNTNTGVSIGIIVLLFGGFSAVMLGINGMKTDIGATRVEIAAVKMEVNAKIDKVDTKVIALEAGKNSVTPTEFLRWAIHLQQSNADVKKLQAEGLKVPEPEVNSK